MKIAMIRVGVDTGSGGIHGPLYEDGRFEFIPIPDGFSLDERNYGNTIGRLGLPLNQYFRSKHSKVADQSLHFDPEFTTYTYGDPTPPKARLRYLEPGDMLIFYSGLEGWDFESSPALYLIGYFEVLTAGYAKTFSTQTLHEMFANNFHVRHPAIFKSQVDRLVLVKGNASSRLLKQAVLMSEQGQNRLGKPLKVLSKDMQKVFGDFNGRISFQRSPTRWVDHHYIEQAAEFMRSLA